MSERFFSVMVSYQQVGACSLELEEMKKLNIDENGKLVVTYETFQ
jgi:hypothetical protein